MLAYKRYSRVKRRDAHFIVLACLFLFGVFAGKYLCQRAAISALRLSNLVGIGADLVGVLVLSHLIATSDKVKSFVLVWLSFISAWGLLIIPLGLFSACVIGLFAGWPSTTAVGAFAAGMLFLAAPMIAVFEDVAMLPYQTRFPTIDAKVSALGGLYILGGLVIQFFVAWYELVGSQFAGRDTQTAA